MHPVPLAIAVDNTIAMPTPLQICLLASLANARRHVYPPQAFLLDNLPRRACTGRARPPKPKMRRTK